MTTADMYINERLDHLGIVAGVCQEIGLADWLDTQDPTHRKPRERGNGNGRHGAQRVGLQQSAVIFGTTVLCRASPSSTCWERGSLQRGESVDCLGRTLDWLYAYDLTKLFAGIASRARKIFGIKAEQVHVDTTSFSVSGEYANEAPRAKEPAEREASTEAEAALIAITYGYSRDHRDDLKQWMCALATTHDGDAPLFLQPLDGNSSDKVSLLAVIQSIQAQLREVDGEASLYVADNGLYSASTMKHLNQAGVKWASRISETLTEARTVLQEGSDAWQHAENGAIHWFCRELELPQGTERWVIVRTHASQQRAQRSMQRQVSRAQTSWQQKCWHLGNRRFGCRADARAAFEHELKGKPTWLEVHSELVAHPHHPGKGRPRKDARPATHHWQIVATVTVKQERVEEEALRKACFIVGTNVLDTAVLSDHALVT